VKQVFKFSQRDLEQLAVDRIRESKKSGFTRAEWEVTPPREYGPYDRTSGSVVLVVEVTDV
jgi:hypothetical protein